MTQFHIGKSGPRLSTVTFHTAYFLDTLLASYQF